MTPRRARRRRRGARPRGGRLVRRADASLLDLVDNLLNKGVVLDADVMLSIADVDMIYLRLSALVCAADRQSTIDNRGK